MKKVDVTSTLFSEESLSRVEKSYNCKYVFETSPFDRSKTRLCQTMAVFYNETPHPDGSNYMGVFFRSGEMFVTDALPHIADYYNCVEAENGQIIYSRHRHDYRESDDESVTIDGGQDYLKYGWTPKFKDFNPEENIKQFKIVDGEVRIIERGIQT